jgi:hypothetical protein
MDSADSYRETVRQLTRPQFVLRFPHPFLLKHAIAAAQRRPLSAHDWDEPFSFGTRTVDTTVDPEADLDEQGPVAGELRVAAVRKREGNPFPERFSVGRARNCDVVLRFASVSKLHAHLLPGTARGGAPLMVVDERSKNGTRLNGRALEPGEPVAVHFNDTLRFGALDVQFVDAGTLYDVLAAT